MRLLLLLAAPVILADEYAVLHNGFRIMALRHETEGAVVRLHTRDGVIELPVNTIAGYEPIEAPIVPPAPAPKAPPPVPPRVVEPKELVERAALRNGLPPEFLHSVATVESAYQPAAISPKGAIGIMQLMPRTAAALNADPLDPEQNVEAGARHLRDLLLRYDGQTRKALAAYNAGAGAVERYGGVPPYRETQLYVEKVLRLYNRKLEDGKAGQ